MIALDTNVLIRYFIADDKKQFGRVVKYLEKNCSDVNPAFVSSIVLCEIVWVLEVSYSYKKSVIIDVIGRMLTTSELLIEHQDAAISALRSFEEGKADFSDYYIAYIGKKFKVDKTITFDKKAAKHNLFEEI